VDVFWDGAPCRLVEVHRLFRRGWCLNMKTQNIATFKNANFYVNFIMPNKLISLSSNKTSHGTGSANDMKRFSSLSLLSDESVGSIPAAVKSPWKSQQTLHRKVETTRKCAQVNEHYNFLIISKYLQKLLKILSATN
jgi:hypothetical protein